MQGHTATRSNAEANMLDAVKARRGPWGLLRGFYSNSFRHRHPNSAASPSTLGNSPYRYLPLPSRESMDESPTSTSNLAQVTQNGMPESPPPKGKYGDASFGDLVHLTTVVIRIPFVTLWISLHSLIFHPKTVKRSTVISFIRWISGKCNYKEIQYLTPPSVDAYKMWAKKHKFPIIVEELVDDAAVMWIGPKRRDKVVLFIPGGAYLFPLNGSAISFWRYVQLELEKDGCDVGFAILGYSLIPTAGFPTQLRQATLAVEHIIASGVHPSNLHIVGDSAGGHLILSLLSHILHPLPDSGIRPIIPLEAPIRGVYLMSPWVCMKRTTASYRSNAAYDIVVPTSTPHSDLVEAYITKEYQLPYIDPLNNPDSWFLGLDAVVDRLFMSAGGMEVLRDDIISFSQTLNKVKANFSFTVQEGGVHSDPHLDFVGRLQGDRVGSLTPLIISWLATGIRAS